MSANGIVPPDACRKRTSIVTGAGARAGLDELHVASRGVEHVVVALVDRVGERPVLQPLLVEAEDSREAARRRLDDAVAGQQHRDRRRVLHQRTEPRDLVAGDFPAPAFGEVAHAEHEVVAERRADHLDQTPAVGAADRAARAATRPPCPARS